MSEKVQIAPSLLSADFCNLERDVRMIERGAPDWLHVDVMDGHFVPNLTLGPPVIKALKKIARTKLDVHLMISNTAEQLDSFLATGADLITIHVENADRPATRSAVAGSSPSIEKIDDVSGLLELIERIHVAGASAGVSLNPDTSASVLAPLIEYVDVVLVMSVHPGFGGQGFIESSLQKIAEIAEMARACKAAPVIEVDGGINMQTAPLAVAAGAKMLVAGNAIFAASEPLVALAAIRKACESCMAGEATIGL